MTGANPQTLRSLVETKRLIVCCGAGGVGKTTTAAAISLAAARLGRKVLVLTIDPSRRLAEALGVSRNPPEPVVLPIERQRATGIVPPGSLEAWMLDPKLISDNAVRRFAGSEEAARPILQNRLYQEGTSLVAGLHEYTAMKAMHQFVTDGKYDLVVLDTPPSRNALDFLEAPGRFARFVEGPIIKMFVPTEGSLVSRAGTHLVKRVLAAVFSQEFADELSVFFGVFARLLSSLSTEMLEVRARLSRDDAAFLLITTPSQAALREAHFFHDKIRHLGLPFRGFVLNRSQVGLQGNAFPTPEVLPEDASSALKTGIEKLKWLGRIESLHVSRDRGLLADLALKSGKDAFAIALPSIAASDRDFETLTSLAEVVLTERRSGPRHIA